MTDAPIPFGSPLERAAAAFTRRLSPSTRRKLRPAARSTVREIARDCKCPDGHPCTLCQHADNPARSVDNPKGTS